MSRDALGICLLLGSLLGGLLSGLPGSTVVHAAELDVRVVLDISAHQQSDPVEAATALVRALPANARAGIWTFGRFVNRLVPLETVDEAWRRDALAALSTVRLVAPTSDLAKALADAARTPAFDPALERHPDRHIVVLSPHRPPEVPGFTIHTDAHGFLAAQTRRPGDRQRHGNGRMLVVDAADDTDELTFLAVDAGLRTIFAPDGRAFDIETAAQDVRWLRSSGFDFVTLSGPAPGTWRVDADDASRVAMFEHIELATEGIPEKAFPGYEPSAEFALVDGRTVLNQPVLLNNLRIEATMGGEVVPVDPIFDGLGVPTGRYRLHVEKMDVGLQTFVLAVLAPTFERAERRVVAVEDPVSIEVWHGKTGDTIVMIALDDDSIDANSVEVAARVRNDLGADSQMTATPVGDEWRLTLPAGLGSSAMLNLDIQGNYLINKVFNVSHGPVEVALEPPAPTSSDGTQIMPAALHLDEMTWWLAAALGNLFALFGLGVAFCYRCTAQTDLAIA